MAAEWLCANQGAFEHGEAILVRLLQNDPQYYPAMNNLAYCYALSGQPQLAPPLMERYVAALPNEPNPQDSYGEMMRMLGDYPAALEHYQKALAINPHFNPSQVGVASTFRLAVRNVRHRAVHRDDPQPAAEHPRAPPAPACLATCSNSIRTGSAPSFPRPRDKLEIFGCRHRRPCPHRPNRPAAAARPAGRGAPRR